jgi:hypothetical protein
MINLKPGDLIKVTCNRLWLTDKLVPFEVQANSIGMLLSLKKEGTVWATYTIKVLLNEQVLITQGSESNMMCILSPVDYFAHD